MLIYSLFSLGNKPVSVREKVMYNSYCFKGSFSFLKWFFCLFNHVLHDKLFPFWGVLYTLAVYPNSNIYMNLFIEAYLIMVKAVTLSLYLSYKMFHTNTTWPLGQCSGCDLQRNYLSGFLLCDCVQGRQKGIAICHPWMKRNGIRSWEISNDQVTLSSVDTEIFLDH